MALLKLDHSADEQSMGHKNLSYCKYSMKIIIFYAPKRDCTKAVVLKLGSIEPRGFDESVSGVRRRLR